MQTFLNFSGVVLNKWWQTPQAFFYKYFKKRFKVNINEHVKQISFEEILCWRHAPDPEQPPYLFASLNK